MAYGNITYNGITLEVKSITPVKRQKTKKSIIGKTIVEANIIGLNAQQWELRISGTITTDIDTNRTALEASDDVDYHAYVDGIHSGNYVIMPNTLSFEDLADDVGMYYKYSFVLLEQ